MSQAADLPWGLVCGQSDMGWAGATGAGAAGEPLSASQVRTQGPDNPEVTESVGSAGGGAGQAFRLSGRRGAGRIAGCRGGAGRRSFLSGAV